MKIVVTGGAGFIGSCIVRALNDNGYNDVIIVDHIASTEKWKNLRNKKYAEYVHKSAFLSKLYDYKDINAVIHMGACSSTTEMDFDYLWKNNVEYSKTLWNYCAEKNIPFIYASSAATYGEGSLGFSDNIEGKLLMPMNAYGYSKHAFDLWARQQDVRPKQYAGLKFFNVYGPNEYCKGSMASMVYHGYRQIRETGKIRLFKSYKEGYKDGFQLRDFIYVKDICDVVMWLLSNPEVNGIFNAGTGEARSFQELAEAVFEALELKPNIEYIEMPPEIKDRYQYYTRAEMHSLQAAGFSHIFYSVRGGNKEGVRDYVQNYLDKGFEIY